MSFLLEARQNCIDRVRSNPVEEFSLLYTTQSIIPNVPAAERCLYNGGHHETGNDLFSPNFDIIPRGKRRDKTCQFCRQIVCLVRQNRSHRQHGLNRLLTEKDVNSYLHTFTVPLSLEKVSDGWVADPLTNNIMLSYAREHPCLLKIYFAYICENYRVIIAEAPGETLQDYLDAEKSPDILSKIPDFFQCLYSSGVFVHNLQPADIFVVDQQLKLHPLAAISWQIAPGVISYDEDHYNLDFSQYYAEEESRIFLQLIKEDN